MAEKLVHEPVDSAGEQGPAGPTLVAGPSFFNNPLSLVTATATHNYIVEYNIAKKEIDPTKILQFMKKHVSPYDFCGGPMRSPFFMVIGMLSRSDYLANRFDRAKFYMNSGCSVYGDFAIYQPNIGGLMTLFGDIKQEAYDDAKKPYKLIMDKLKMSYPKKAHTMLDVDPETDAIIIKSDVKFEGKRHYIVHYTGGQRIRYT